MTALAERPVVLELPRLRPDQSSIARHPAKVKVVAMGRRWGKTVLGLVLALACVAAGGFVAWVVPTYKNGNPLWRAAEAAVAKLPPGVVRLNRAERSIELLSSGGALWIFSADNADAMRGWSFNLVIVDEAARIAEEAYTDVIQPTLADVDGDLILISTPKGRNFFWREFQRGLLDGKDIKSWTAPSSANPSAQIRRAAELARTRVPESTYRQEWLAEFVQDGTNPFDGEWWANGRNRFSAVDRANRNRIIARWLSFDTAMKDKDSSDYTSCTVGELTRDYKLQIRHVWREHLRFPDLVAAIERSYVEWNVDGKLHAIIIEDRVSGTSAYQTLVASTRNPDLARMCVAYNPGQMSKRARASLAAVWCKNDCIELPYPSDSVIGWLPSFEAELFSFTGTVQDDHDDQVDSFTQLVLYLEESQKILSTGYYARLDALQRATVRRRR